MQTEQQKHIHYKLCVEISVALLPILSARLRVFAPRAASPVMACNVIRLLTPSSLSREQIYIIQIKGKLQSAEPVTHDKNHFSFSSLWETERNEIPISRQFFFRSAVLFSVLWSASDDEGGGGQSVSTIWRYRLTDLHRYANVLGYSWVVEAADINWCLCVCSLPLCVPATVSRSLFLRSLFDGYVLYLKPDAYSAWAKLFMMLQAVCGCHTGFTVRAYNSPLSLTDVL